MDLKLKRTPGIYLTGFMGSGKSTIGHILADRLGWEFVDIDAEVEAAAQMTVTQIFETKGEAEFRRLETEMIRDLTRKVERGMPVVVALGGGAFVQPGNYELVAHKGVSIWLDCPFEAVEKRIEGATATRPLARDPEALRRLYDARTEGYSKADHRVAAGGDINAVIEGILQLPFWK